MINKKQFSSSAYVKKAVHEYREAPAHRSGEAQRLRVISVEAGSLAERIGLKAGDEIHELNGKPLLDVIDFQFNAATIGRRTITTREKKIYSKRQWESFGLEFAL
jgi:S1-C subfamily serine protease